MIIISGKMEAFFKDRGDSRYSTELHMCSYSIPPRIDLYFLLYRRPNEGVMRETQPSLVFKKEYLFLNYEPFLNLNIVRSYFYH